MILEERMGVKKEIHFDNEKQILAALIEVRKSVGMTQKDLSEKTGIAQPDISKIERGMGNPSIKTLSRIADGLGMDLHIEFMPRG